MILVPTPQPTATPVPAPTPDGVARTVQVPILMYHHVSVPPADADVYRRDLSVAPDLLLRTWTACWPRATPPSVPTRSSTL
ncbi:MAG: hypothetical protein R3A10_21435 [Caldilineaceae bacterium]